MLGAVSTYGITNPALRVNPAQDVILKEYLKTYCYKSRPANDSARFVAAGEAAVLSRLTISAGIGEVALAEYARCRFWQGVSLP